MGMIDRFEVSEPDEDEFCAHLQVRSVCASVKRQPDGMYFPYVTDDEISGYCAKGQALSTKELAAQSAISLAIGHLAAMSMAFAGFTETADMVTR